MIKWLKAVWQMNTIHLWHDVEMRYWISEFSWNVPCKYHCLFRNFLRTLWIDSKAHSALYDHWVVFKCPDTSWMIFYAGKFLWGWGRGFIPTLPGLWQGSWQYVITRKDTATQELYFLVHWSSVFGRESGTFSFWVWIEIAMWRSITKTWNDNDSKSYLWNYSWYRCSLIHIYTCKLGRFIRSGSQPAVAKETVR